MAFPRERILRGRGLTLALVMLAACATSTSASPPHKKVVENLPDARALDGRRAALPDGQYTCTIEDQGVKYPSFPCVIATSNGKVSLEKTAGSQRLRGAVTMTDSGFHFEGELFCPYGDCTQPIVAEFTRVEDYRHYVGTIRTSSGVIHFDLRYRPGGPAAYERSVPDEPYDVQPASERLAPKPLPMGDFGDP